MANYIKPLRDEKSTKEQLVALGAMSAEGIHAIGDIFVCADLSGIESSTIPKLGSALLILSNILSETIDKLEGAK